MLLLIDAPDYSIDHATWRLVAATWGLVIATALLVAGAIGTFLYGFFRDKKEDAQRKKEAEPKALIELATYEKDNLKMAFVVFNLGNNSFVIDKLVVQGTGRVTVDVPQQRPTVLTPGTSVVIDFEPRLILSNDGGNIRSEEAYCTAILKGATGIAEVQSGWFHVFYANAQVPYRFPWSVGHRNLPPGTLVEPPRVLP